MECCVYIRREIRNLRQIIITQKDFNNGYALVIYQHFSNKNNLYVANYLPLSTINLDTNDSNCKCYSNGIYGCLGLICVKDETFLVLVTKIENLGVFDGKTINRITNVAFISLTSSAYDFTLDNTYNIIYQEDETNTVIQNHPCSDLIKYLSRGTFYFSNEFDLTHCAQNRFMDDKKRGSYLECANDNFFWNKYLLKELLNFRKHLLDYEKAEFDKSGIFLVVIQGFVIITHIKTVDEDAQMCLISRLSCKRVGTRFNARGIDDDGNVANFVESEILFHSYEYYFSFLQIRGSIPLFWEQPQTTQMTHKIELARGMESTAPAFKRHFENMIKQYGNVYILNLLSKKQGSGEAILGREFENHYQICPDTLKTRINKLDFDFHERYKNGEYNGCEEILNIINNDLDNYSYFLMKNNVIVSKQLGVMRVNCLDCLDRTNVVQTNLAWHIFRKFFLNEKKVNYCSLVYGDDNFKTVFYNIWADNGDNLSQIYAGTGALKSSITRKGKQTVLGYLNDAKKSINRFVNNTFFDKSRQETINLMLGRLSNQMDVVLHDPLSEAVKNEMDAQKYTFSSKSNITIFAGSWNVNGRTPNEDLLEWLSPEDENLPDIYLIGIQEIVELTPQQVMSTDPEKRKTWEAKILGTLKEIDSSYVHLKSRQLVGAFISIYIREKDVECVRNVESVLIKTGLKGLAGNKGGVAISLDYCDTSVCFITAHLASGQQNVEDRNRDYNTISEGLIFQGGRKIKDHDVIIWLGDFNFRINYLTNESVRQLILENDIEELLKYDQLIQQIENGRAFENYKEGKITFNPTYKFNNNSDVYDTSEKARIPAWCDRILYKGEGITQKYYKSANLRSSDHKPVKSLFTTEIIILDKEKKRKIEKEIYAKQLVIFKNEQLKNKPQKKNPFLDSDDDYTNQYPQLKKPSSEFYQWWDLKLIEVQSPDSYSNQSTLYNNSLSDNSELLVQVDDDQDQNKNDYNNSLLKENLSTKLQNKEIRPTRSFTNPLQFQTYINNNPNNFNNSNRDNGYTNNNNNSIPTSNSNQIIKNMPFDNEKKLSKSATLPDLNDKELIRNISNINIQNKNIKSGNENTNNMNLIFAKKKQPPPPPPSISKKPTYLRSEVKEKAENISNSNKSPESNSIVKKKIPPPLPPYTPKKNAKSIQENEIVNNNPKENEISVNNTVVKKKVPPPVPKKPTQLTSESKEQSELVSFVDPFDDEFSIE